jgi:cellulase/cellobiase CelA1
LRSSISLDPIISARQRPPSSAPPFVVDWRLLRLNQYVFGVMSPVAGTVARWIVPFLAVAAIAGPQVGPAPAILLVDAANPLVGEPFFVDPTSAAMAAAHKANPPSPELDAIANTPQAFWIDQAVPSSAISRYVGGAQAAGSLPVLAVYAIPHRDCGSFTAGGFATAADYRQWIDGVAATVAPRPRQSSSNPMRSTWPTACQLASATNATVSSATPSTR